MSTTMKIESNSGSHDMIAILDFGSQYSHLIARRVRELNVFCELFSCETTLENLNERVGKHNLRGIIFSGGPFSVYEDGAPHVNEDVWKYIQSSAELPLLGICYGLQEIATLLGGKVEASSKREYGHTMVTLEQVNGTLNDAGGLLKSISNPFQCWMSHGDKLTKKPEGFQLSGTTANSEFAAIAFPEKKIYGLQFHPEVTHTPEGSTILKNFVVGICGCSGTWNMKSLLHTMEENIRAQVGEDKHVIGAVSGGVDSTVAAVLMNRAIGNRFHAILVDNGCLRKDEASRVLDRLRNRCGIDLKCVDASEQFMKRLEGVSDPEKKRKIIGNLFIELFEQASKEIKGDVQFLLQGTLYPDVIESCSYKGPSATIKTHHNVGGLPDRMNLKLIEPLRELFKDEVRSLGLALGIERESVFRHPFPGPGLAIRMLGAIDKASLDILREADAIFIEELRKNNLYEKIGQAFAVLLPCKSVGVMGDGRTYERVVALRAVETSDYMTAGWFQMPYDVLATCSTRIINEVKGVNRVVYDISSKPPATIEWE